MTLNHYQQQRWQLHAQLQLVRNALENLEQQLSEIDAGLLELNPEQQQTAHGAVKASPATLHSVNTQDTPLPIAAG
jgi:hypothetical protein